MYPSGRSSAWLAVCPASSDESRPTSGTTSRRATSWFCEAAWDGPYADGGFDETDIVFGTGVRIRSDRVVFVPSGGTDRPADSMRTADALYVSNSLACLLSFVDGSLDLANPDYRTIFDSVTKGIGHYQRYVPTTAGPVRLTYFDNLVWDGAERARGREAVRRARLRDLREVPGLPRRRRRAR